MVGARPRSRIQRRRRQQREHRHPSSPRRGRRRWASNRTTSRGDRSGPRPRRPLRRRHRAAAQVRHAAILHRGRIRPNRLFWRSYRFGERAVRRRGSWQHSNRDRSGSPREERRRYALVSAAADLLCEGGFEAVSHRAVAQRARLPLASTTYYSSLDDLIVNAAHIGMMEAGAAARPGWRSCRGAARTRGDRRRCWSILVGEPASEPSASSWISRYERYIACARQPALCEPSAGCCASGSTRSSRSSPVRAAGCASTC
jgi:hypothetical protein